MNLIGSCPSLGRGVPRRVMPGLLRKVKETWLWRRFAPPQTVQNLARTSKQLPISVSRQWHSLFPVEEVSMSRRVELTHFEKRIREERAAIRHLGEIRRLMQRGLTRNEAEEQIAERLVVDLESGEWKRA